MSFFKLSLTIVLEESGKLQHKSIAFAVKGKVRQHNKINAEIIPENFINVILDKCQAMI